MKYLKTYEQYDEFLNEGKILDFLKKELPKMNFQQAKEIIGDILSKINIGQKKYFIAAIMALLINVFTTEEISQILPKEKMEQTYLKPYDEFVKAVGMRESSGRWCVQKGQFLGYFQLGESAFKDIGVNIKEIGKKNYLNNPKLQKKCFRKWMDVNKKYMKDVIKEWDGKEINGIKVTESGILMGAHLVGQGNAKKFFNSNGNIIPKDGNGTPITEYIKMFSGYQI